MHPKVKIIPYALLFVVIASPFIKGKQKAPQTQKESQITAPQPRELDSEKLDRLYYYDSINSFYN